jgi:hypothetical protein
LIARKIAEIFGFDHGICPFEEACHFDELGRGFDSCLLKASFETAVSQCHNSIFTLKLMTMAAAGAIWCLNTRPMVASSDI